MKIGSHTIPVAIITVLFIFICLFAFFKLFGPIPFFVQNITTTKTSLFSVDGVGEATGIPDTAMVSFGVSKTASTVQSAKDQVNEIANKITEDLKKLGVNEKDIKTTNYSVNPQYDYSGGTQRLTGYVVNTNMQAKLQPIDKANQAIDITTQDGATQVNGVQFIVNDSKEKELTNEARKKAIADAKEKAQNLADAASMRLGRIVDIKENAQSPRPYPILMGAEKAGGGEPTQLNPGENTITSTITLSYETY